MLVDVSNGYWLNPGPNHTKEYTKWYSDISLCMKARSYLIKAMKVVLSVFDSPVIGTVLEGYGSILRSKAIKMVL